MILIGIDTGVSTGFAWSINGKFQSIDTESILSAQERVLNIASDTANAGMDVIVCIEDVRLRKWVPKGVGNERMQGVGSVKRDCSIWQEFCERNGLQHIFVAPKAIQTKLSEKDFNMITQWPYKTSEHARDAGMMIYKVYRLLKRKHINIPVKFEPKIKKPRKPALYKAKKERGL
jgi:hypothetical protein